MPSADGRQQRRQVAIGVDSAALGSTEPNAPPVANVQSVVGAKPLGKITGHADGLSSVAWSPDGKQLATCSDFNTRITLWDSTTWQPLQLIPGCKDTYVLGFSPDGQLLLASGRPKLDSNALPMVAQFWEVATGQPVGSVGPLWIVATVAAVTFLIFGIVFFWKAEERYGRD